MNINADTSPHQRYFEVTQRRVKPTVITCLRLIDGSLVYLNFYVLCIATLCTLPWSKRTMNQKPWNPWIISCCRNKSFIRVEFSDIIALLLISQILR